MTCPLPSAIAPDGWRLLVSGCHLWPVQPYTRTLQGVYRKDAKKYGTSCKRVAAEVALTLRAAGVGNLEEPYRVGLAVQMPATKGAKRLPLTNNDWDNMLKGWVDALQPVGILPGDGPHWFRGPAPVEVADRGLVWPGVEVGESAVWWSLWVEVK